MRKPAELPGMLSLQALKPPIVVTIGSVRERVASQTPLASSPKTRKDEADTTSDATKPSWPMTMLATTLEEGAGKDPYGRSPYAPNHIDSLSRNEKFRRR